MKVLSMEQAWPWDFIVPAQIYDRSTKTKPILHAKR